MTDPVWLALVNATLNTIQTIALAYISAGLAADWRDRRR